MTRWICCHKLSGSVFPKKICLGVGGISFRGKLRRSFVKKALDPCSSVTPRHTVRLLTDPDANEDKSQRSQCMESCNATSSAPSIMLRAWFLGQIGIVVSHDLLTVRRRRRDTRCHYSVRFTCVLWWLSAWLSVNNTGVRFLQVYFVSAP